jgi:nitrate reductase / nitrite oxidoreductase, beta subunit
MLKIFYNPDLPQIDDYYEPWTYDYEKLTNSPLSKHQPATRPKSLLTGENLQIEWGPNWEDDLAGTHVTGREDVNFSGLEREVYIKRIAARNPAGGLKNLCH